MSNVRNAWQNKNWFKNKTRKNISGNRWFHEIFPRYWEGCFHEMKEKNWKHFSIRQSMVSRNFFSNKKKLGKISTFAERSVERNMNLLSFEQCGKTQNSLTKQIFREIIFIVSSLSNVLFSRNFCQNTLYLTWEHSVEKYYKTRSRFLRENQHFFCEINVLLIKSVLRNISWKQVTLHMVEIPHVTLNIFLFVKLREINCYHNSCEIFHQGETLIQFSFSRNFCRIKEWSKKLRDMFSRDFCKEKEWLILHVFQLRIASIIGHLTNNKQKTTTPRTLLSAFVQDNFSFLMG